MLTGVRISPAFEIWVIDWGTKLWVIFGWWIAIFASVVSTLCVGLANNGRLLLFHQYLLPKALLFSLLQHALLFQSLFLLLQSLQHVLLLGLLVLQNKFYLLIVVPRVLAVRFVLQFLHLFQHQFSLLNARIVSHDDLLLGFDFLDDLWLRRRGLNNFLKGFGYGHRLAISAATALSWMVPAETRIGRER